MLNELNTNEKSHCTLTISVKCILTKHSKIVTNLLITEQALFDKKYILRQVSIEIEEQMMQSKSVFYRISIRF